MVLEEGLAGRRCCAPRSRRSRAAAAAAGVEIVAGDTKVVERGHADSMYLCTTGIGLRRRARDALAGRRCGPATAILVSGSIGEHGTAIMLARGEFDLDADVESDTRSLWPAVDALLAAAGPAPALPARRHARRRGVGAERARARLRGRRSSCARRDVPVQPGRRRARPSCSASTRCTSPTRASSSRSSPPSGADGGAGRAARGAGLRGRRRDRRGQDRRRPGWC